MSFPTNLPSYTITSGGETANGAAGGTGLSTLLNAFETDITGLGTKMGTGATTPSANKILYATGTGVSAWQGLTSAQLLALLSDETGTGFSVFSISPTLTTPIIASFASANHNHANSAGGGQLGSSALSNASITPSLLATGAVTATVATAETTANTGYVDLATAGPAVTTTIGANGLALVNISALMSNNTASDSNFMSFAVSVGSTIAASDANSIQYGIAGSGANSLFKMGIGLLLPGLSAGSTTFTAKYRVNAGTGTFTSRTISVVPL